ncbi:MAG: GTPase ObgE [Puniceicoccales bacterium]|jgi:GTP-binding protein|nr:GTPase ObgE [Puniceicoccales bacterium]
MFVDEAIIHLRAGKGGDGCLSFRREKFLPKGGPDGGDGGTGGDVVLRCDENVGDLSAYRFQPQWSAHNGRPGEGRNRHGANGGDCVLALPPGTQVVDLESDLLVAEVTRHGERVVLLEGGRGGLGNTNFKSAVNQAPRKVTLGRAGGAGSFRLVLKTIADAGLVGFPNAGKSTLTGLLTNAHPKVAPYPFTTLHASVGTIEYPATGERVFLADIPGLIKGAHENRGLGHEFLRHVERCRLLVFLLDMGGCDGRRPDADYRILGDELEQHSPALAAKPRLVVANKMDIPEAEKNLRAFKKKFPKLRVLPVSCADGSGIAALRRTLLTAVRREREKGKEAKAAESGEADGE